MSYDLGLYYDGVPAEVERREDGGNYVLGGSTKAELNITYNYSKFYREHLDSALGIRWLYGRVARDTTDRLESAVKALGTKRNKDYWASTPGNAGYALSILLEWARQHPYAVWHGD